jgi:hypothetical protein
MKSKNTTLSLHATLALEIKAAKKTMFKRHREGLPLRMAANHFVADITQRLKKLPFPDALSDSSPPQVPVVSASDNCGRKQFEGIVDEAKLDERDRVQSEVTTILNFFESRSPDFISTAVIDAIDLACDHLGIHRPTYDDDDPKAGTAQTGAILTQLFAKTKLFSLDEVNRVADLSQAISHIATSPITPERLRREVGDFINDISSRIDDSPEKIEKVLGYGLCGYGSCPGSGDPLNPCPGPDASGKHVGEEAEPESAVDTATRPQVTERAEEAEEERAQETPDEVIEKWARTICGYGDDAEAKTAAFLLLMDEIELASRDFLRVSSIVWSAQQAAFGHSDYADQARKRLVKELRAENGRSGETEEDGDHVTVRLPNGKEVDLYGDAADLAKERPDQVVEQSQRIVDAVNEIFSNPRTPGDLYEKVAEFVVETVNERGETNERGARDSLIYSKAMVPVIIAAHPEDELQGAIETARAAKEAQQ